MKRIGTVSLGLVLLSLTACPPPPVTTDVVEGGPPDATDIAPLDSADASDATDTTVADEGFDVSLPADAGPCHLANAPVELLRDPHRATRAVSLISDTDGYDFSVAGSVMPAGEAIWFLTTDPAGVSLTQNTITRTPPAAHVTGGALVVQTLIYTVVYTSDETGSPQVYAIQVQGNGMPITTSRQQVSTATTAVDAPSIANRAAGYFVAWRSRETAGSRVVLQPLGAGLVAEGTATAINEADFDVESFRLLSSPLDGTFAVAYMGMRSGTRELRVIRFDAAGVPGTSTLIASGAQLGSEMDATADATNVAVVWTQTSGSPLALQIVGASGADAGAPIGIDGIPTPASSPGIARESRHLVIGYRAGSGPATFLGFVRVARDRTVRDVSLLSVVAPGGRVGVATASGGRYAIGSADDEADSTVARFMVMLCPL